MTMTEQEVVALMESSRSGEDWDANCDKVRDAFGGHYPDFWFEAINVSGVAKRTLARFGETDKIKIITYP